MKGQKGYALIARPEAVFANIWHHITRWYELGRQRRALAKLPESALKDIGLSRADILRESERHFWDDPLGK